MIEIIFWVDLLVITKLNFAATQPLKLVLNPPLAIRRSIRKHAWNTEQV